MNPNGQPQNPNPYPPQPGGYPPTPQPGQPQPTPQQTYPQQQAQFIPQQQAQPTVPMPGMPASNGPMPYSADYLDSIAPPASGPKFFSGSFTWILIGLALVFMFAVGLLSMGGGNENTASAQQAYVRFDNFSKTIPSYNRYIKSNKLSATATDFKLFMTGAKRDLQDPLAQNGITDTAKQIPAELKSKEKTYAAAIAAKLEDGRLNVNLDVVYAREMSFETKILLDLYQKMAKSNSKSIKDNATKTIPNLQAIQKSFEEFSNGGALDQETESSV